MQLANWRIETTDDICRLTLDKPGGSQNVLSGAVIAELDLALDEIERAKPGALFLCSAKTRGFIAGADVGEFSAIENRAQAEELLATAHRVFDRLAALPLPSIALINGHCLGGGLELALACDYRVACNQPSIRLGLPEVMLGIHPGFGGVARLIESIGVLAAMDLMLSGRSVNPATARRFGIVDFAVPKRQLERTARYVIERRPPPRRVKGWKKWLNRAPLPIRSLVAKALHKKIAARVNPEHYPAPYQLLELWRQHGVHRTNLPAAERESVAQLITTPTSRNLVKVFFLREKLKKAGANGGRFERIHVIGAGVMGGDIAAWCALRGMTATLHDQNPEALANATRRARDLFKRKLKSPRLVRRAMDRFQPDLAGHGVRRADVVIEAIVENADAKIGVFSEVQKIARPDALLATNTSSIPLETLCAGLSAPQRLVGLHFFNPVAKMQLVEVVSGAQTSADVAHRAAAFAGRIGRLPVAVKSAPGFLVNRILTPYLLEAVELLDEGVPAATIDRAATEFGMLMGPVMLADTVGLDICLRVAQNLGDDDVPALLQQKVEAGKLGKKSGEGFYEWVEGKVKKGRVGGVGIGGIVSGIVGGRGRGGSGGSVGNGGRGGAGNGDDRGGDGWDWASANIQDRLIFRLLNEALTCLHEGIVEHPDHLDAALVFGAGFAPFRGGPIHYITEQGHENLRRKINTLQEQYGNRFTPGAGWETFAPEEKTVPV